MGLDVFPNFGTLPPCPHLCSSRSQLWRSAVISTPSRPSSVWKPSPVWTTSEMHRLWLTFLGGDTGLMNFWAAKCCIWLQELSNFRRAARHQVVRLPDSQNVCSRRWWKPSVHRRLLIRWHRRKRNEMHFQWKTKDHANLGVLRAKLWRQQGFVRPSVPTPCASENWCNPWLVPFFLRQFVRRTKGSDHLGPHKPVAAGPSWWPAA